MKKRVKKCRFHQRDISFDKPWTFAPKRINMDNYIYTAYKRNVSSSRILIADSNTLGRLRSRFKDMAAFYKHDCLTDNDEVNEYILIEPKDYATQKGCIVTCHWSEEFIALPVDSIKRILSGDPKIRSDYDD